LGLAQNLVALLQDAVDLSERPVNALIAAALR